MSSSPQLCVGFLFLILYPGPPPRPPPPPPSSSLSHTIFVNHLSHTFVHHHLCHNLSLFVKPSFTHHLFTHPSLSTTVFHTHLCQPSFTHHPSLSSHLSHTIFHTHLCQPSFTHTHHLSHTIFVKPSFTHYLFTNHSLSTTIFHTHLCQPSFTHVKASFTHHLSHLRFTWQAWQAWDPVASTFVLRGRRGTCRTGLALVARLGWDWSAYHFSWQAWLSVASTVVLRGRRGTCGTGRGTCGTGLALVARLGWGLVGVTPRHFAWQAWDSVASTFVLCGRRGTLSHELSFCVAGEALVALGWLWWRAWAGIGGVMLRHFAWQVWHAVASTVVLGGQAWHSVSCTFVWRGMRGTCGTGLALVARLGWDWSAWRRGTLRGRRGTLSHPPSFCVAGVALCLMNFRFAWQAWHLWHWAGSGGGLGLGIGRRDAAALCVAGVGLCRIHLRFAWQAWHSVSWTFVLRGRRGTYGTGLALVAGLGWDWSAWRRGTLRGSSGTLSHPPSFCVAGVVQGLTGHFALQKSVFF